MKKLLFMLIFLPLSLFSQVAIFRADSTKLFSFCGSNHENYNRALEMEWRIHGQSIRFGSTPIEIIPDSNRIDTMFYKQTNNSKWDTFICIIKEPLNYRFVYNDCCDGFYVAMDSGKFLVGKIIFNLAEKPNKKTYLGTLGESGILVNSLSSDTLLDGCRSPMTPNVYRVTFSEIKICNDTANCREGTCLFVKDDAELNSGFGFKTISCKTSFLYLPLGMKPLQLTYDPKGGEILIK